MIEWQQLLQYRLLTMFIVTAIIAMWLAWWSNSAKVQREAVATIYKAGGWVRYDFADHNKPGQSRPDLHRPPYWPTWLVDSLGVDYFACVSGVYFEPGATDADILTLEQLDDLKWLNLQHAQISDIGLRHLRGLSQLRLLNLSDTQITDTGLEHLKSLSNLNEIQLYQTKASDAGISHLQRSLPNCKIFH